MRTKASLLGLLSVLWCWSAAQTPQLRQVSIGQNSIATDISADGQYVVGGTLIESAPRPFLWTPSGGERVLPLPAGAHYAMARGVSNDGSVIAGEAYFQSPSYRILPVVWRAPNYQPQLLNVPDGAGNYYIAGISGDGRIIAATRLGTNLEEMVYWQDGVYHRVDSGRFRAISRCGNYIVGNRGSVPVRWVRSLNRFDVLTDSRDAWYPFAVASGGSPIVGFGGFFGYKGIYWDPCGVISLGDFNGQSVELYAISDDGRTAVGWLRGQPAIRWKRERGFLDGYENLNVTFAGLLQGRTLRSAHAISADGRYIAGSMWIGPAYFAFWLDTAGL